MKWYSDLDCEGQNVLKFAMIAAILIVAVFLISTLSSCSGCRNTATCQQEQEREMILSLEYKNKLYEEMLRAYNHVLHRVWIDNPNYVEDCLNETDEFCELNDFLDGGWGDTFTFYNEQDSIQYHANWNNGDVRQHLKHTPINEPARSRLKSVFGDDFE